jgi:hypothetical protein
MEITLTIDVYRSTEGCGSAILANYGAHQRHIEASVGAFDFVNYKK